MILSVCWNACLASFISKEFFGSVSVLTMSWSIPAHRKKNSIETRFKSGHEFFPRKEKPSKKATKRVKKNATSDKQPFWGPRMDKEWYDLAVRRGADGLPKLSDCEGKLGPVKLLRARKEETEHVDCDVEDADACQMLPIHKGKTEIFMSEASADHHLKFPECDEPSFKMNTVKISMSWKVTVTCRNCGYLSQQYKLYDEVDTGKRGQKPSAATIGLATGVLDSPIGVEKTRHILASAGIPPPSRSGLQKSLKKVGEKVTTLAKKDTEIRRKKLKQVFRK